MGNYKDCGVRFFTALIRFLEADLVLVLTREHVNWVQTTRKGVKS